MAKGLNSAAASIDAVITLLAQHAFEARDIRNSLQEQLTTITSANIPRQIEALRRVRSMTHPKLLGDVSLKGISWSIWSNALERMRRECGRAINNIKKAQVLEKGNRDI